MSHDQRRSRTGPRRHRITVLGSFTLSSTGTAVPLSVDARRLVAYLAVHFRPQAPATLAADLWPGVPPDAAARLLTEAMDAVDVPGLVTTGSDGVLSLGGEVDVDLVEALALVRALPGLPASRLPGISLLSADILPDWTGQWIVVERERFRQIRLAALEELSARLSAVGRHDEAVAVALEAVRAAPSRETARRALIEAHLAQGDIAAAVAQYDEYHELLRSSVGGPVPSGLDTLLPPAPAWPVLRARRTMPRSAVVLPRLQSVRRASGSGRRLVAGGSVPGTAR